MDCSILYKDDNPFTKRSKQYIEINEFNFLMDDQEDREFANKFVQNFKNNTLGGMDEM